MTKIDIFSGFLGAGKTTLIKKLIAEAYSGEKLVLIENEFGEINIDGGFLKESGIEISEMSAGCICCSLVGDFMQLPYRCGMMKTETEKQGLLPRARRGARGRRPFVSHKKLEKTNKMTKTTRAACAVCPVDDDP